ncbi:MAG: hypothetical protein KDA89_07000, partial [Planctomycetaceae bacterium]|nr:hypothetical protein [Planctomycetaceae bacterium]
SETSTDDNSPAHQPPDVPGVALAAAQTVASAEIPFVLSLLLEPLKHARDRRRSAREFVSTHIEESTDTDGTLHGSLMNDIAQWMAPIVRMSVWSAAFQQDWCGSRSGRRWRSFLDRTALMLTPDGFLTTQRTKESDLPANNDDVSVMNTAVAVCGKSESSPTVRQVRDLSDGRKISKVLRKAVSTKQRKDKTPKKKSKALSCQSDWASAAILRNTRNIDADALSLTWDSSQVRLGLSVCGTSLISGDWACDVRVNGQLLQPNTFSCSCWYDDNEAAFAELEAKNDDGLIMVRHVLLSLDQHYAVVTDTVTAPSADDVVEFESHLPLAASIVMEKNSITRDVFLHGDYVSTRAVPLWVPDDRIQQTDGNCDQDDRRLTLSDKGTGGTCTALLLDWHPERRTSEPDWARLTVTEDRRVVTRHEAAGFRLRISDLQLMLYRNLRGGQVFRAVLGHHTRNETVYGKISSTGDVEPIVMVEAGGQSEGQDPN